MPSRFTSLLACLLLTVPGCGRMFAGFDGKINHSVSGRDWDEVNYGYLTIESEPPGAIVSLQGEMNAAITMKAGVDVEEKKEFNETSDWAVIGSTPVTNYKMATSGKDVSRKIGSSMHSTFDVSKVSIRLEKPGYETTVIENVVFKPSKQDPRKIVVELVPVDSESR